MGIYSVGKFKPFSQTSFYLINFLSCIMENDHLLERITFNPDILRGRALIRGMRFLVSDILEMLSNGMSEADILNQHSILEKEDIRAALLYASKKTNRSTAVSTTKPNVFVIPTHMKEGIQQGEEDIKNGRIHTQEDFEKKYEKCLKK
jgi:uncharacterized protein (DUF433 family)